MKRSVPGLCPLPTVIPMYYTSTMSMRSCSGEILVPDNNRTKLRVARFPHPEVSTSVEKRRHLSVRVLPRSLYETRWSRAPISDTQGKTQGVGLSSSNHF
ncbi:hypothetical protein J6590_027053 [Homalodisca vitripennis]|nr:hypothetical protein J6590_027053 [Homalodisca vitripennis]